MANSQGRYRHKLTVRVWLTSLVAACVLPIWLAAGLLLYYAYANKQALVEVRMLDTARALGLTVDREVASIQAALQALATSPLLASGDLVGFHGQAKAVLPSHRDADIILADRTGQQLVNTFLPAGAPLPRRHNGDAVRRIFDTALPVLDGLFAGAVTNRYLVGVDVPVVVDGKVRYDLGMTVPADHFAEILAQQHLPGEWVGTILDQDGRVVARTRNAETYVGRRPDLAVIKVLESSPEGTLQAHNLENIPVYGSFSRSATTGWAILISVPVDNVNSGIGRWLVWAFASIAVLSACGLTLALLMGRHIARSIHALVAPALALGRGEPVTVSPQGLRETEELAEALNRASALLQQRSAEKDEAAALANTDFLTGTASRRSFFEIAEREFSRAIRHDLPLAVIMMDVDHFKSVNDQHGHAAGDSVLRQLVRTTGEILRETDVLGRVGGEEFAILLPHTTLDGARALGERLRSKVARSVIVTERGGLTCTISLGVCARSDHTSSFEAMLVAADKALYRAKTAGRNRVEIA